MPHRKISRPSPEFMNVIFKLANLYDIKDFEYAIEFGCDEVDSYIGGLYRVCLSGKRCGQKVKKSYLIKWHNEPNRRNSLRQSYEREYLFYEIIIPQLLNIEKRFQIIEGLKIKFPNCVYASIERGKEVIVLANVQVHRFVFYDRLRKIDLDHVSLVMKNLAKQHALAFALEKYEPEKFEEIRKACCIDIQYADTNTMSKYMASFYNSSVKVVKDDVLRKKLQDCASNILLILNRCVMPSSAKYLTVCHGDCWNYNVIYKYQKKKPVDVIFIEYQLVRYASPVTDIAYFLYMSTDQQFLADHYERVINLYYRTLSAVLRQCNLDPKEIYPKQIFRKHLVEYSVFGLIEALVSMKIITAETEEALKMTEIKYEYSEVGSFDEETEDSPLYVDRVNGVVNDFFSRNYSLNAVLSNN